VTALGALDGRAPVLRSGARVGDVVAVAGQLGHAGRGLELLFGRFRDAEGEPVSVDPGELTPEEAVAVAAQLRPHPPIVLGPVAADASATAMMDVSDGLVLDASRLAAASGVSVEIDASTLGAHVVDALTGGEDHALLATFPPAVSLPDGFRPIGRIVAPTVQPVLVDGQPHDGRGGWDPYRDWDAHAG
jgi:thiamine-monophosphate kinase